MAGVIVTGVSRQRGIGAAVAARLRTDGWTVCTTGWRGYDSGQHPHDDAPVEIDVEIDLIQPGAAATVVRTATEKIGALDALVLVHAHDHAAGLLDVTAESIDEHLAVNVRASLLLMREFVQQRAAGSGAGRIVIFGSGPPQAGSIAYAASKGALEWIVYSAAAELGPRGITVNAIDPGPTQTGWMSADVEREVTGRTPLQRPGRPDDAAAVVAFLLSEDGAWITGEVITSDGGHRVGSSSWPR